MAAKLVEISEEAQTALSMMIVILGLTIVEKSQEFQNGFAFLGEAVMDAIGVPELNPSEFQ